MKRVAILQSNYVPWKGYFGLIAAVDEFVFYEDVQYTSRDWRNRNRIQTPHGPQWLSIPVHGSLDRLLKDVQICDAGSGRAHWKRLLANYARADFFSPVAAWLEPHYRDAPWERLSVVNRSLVAAICRYLGIGTRLSVSSDFDCAGERSQRLVSMCRQAGADVYVSGPAAKAYLDTAAFERAGIEVEWFDYPGYPEYPQLWHQPFVHELSILDLLFNCGPEARRHMRADTAVAA